MRRYGYFGLGMALAIAAAAFFTAPARACDGPTVTVQVAYHSLDYAFDLPVLFVLDRHDAYRDHDGGTVLMKNQTAGYAPAPNAKAVKPTVQAGWRSGRLRKLSDV